MQAFSRDSSFVRREILIEKSGNPHSINIFSVDDYDTVEVVYYEDSFTAKTIKGILRGFSYRGAKKFKTVGYASVELINKQLFSISDDYGLNKEGKYIQIYPISMILIEKNDIEKLEIMEAEFRASLPYMIMGG